MTEQSFIRIDPDRFPDPDTPQALRSGTMLCPICGGENLHTVGVDAVPVGPARQYVKLTGKGVSMGPEQHARDTKRGNEVCIRFDCESGCQFTVKFRFHKGEVTCSYEDVKTWQQTEQEQEPDWRGDLWRD
jgi:hypothetical protein